MARRKIDPEVGRATQFQAGSKQAQTAKKAALHIFGLKMWPGVWVLRPLPQVAMRLFDGQESVSTLLTWAWYRSVPRATTSPRASSTVCRQ